MKKILVVVLSLYISASWGAGEKPEPEAIFEAQPPEEPSFLAWVYHYAQDWMEFFKGYFWAPSPPWGLERPKR